MKVTSSVLREIDNHDKHLIITFKNKMKYSYDCGTSTRAKIWLGKISTADSAGREYTRFKKLNLPYQIS